MAFLQRMPIRARLTLALLGVFALIFGALAALLAINERTTLLNNATESLELTSRVVVDRLTDQNSDLRTILMQTTIPGESGAAETIGQILDPQSRVVDSSGQSIVGAPIITPTIRSTATHVGHWHGRIHLAGRQHDDMAMVVHLDQGAHSGDLLVLAQTLSGVDRASGNIVRLLLAAAPIAVGLAGIGGWVVAGSALRPVDDLTRRASEINEPGADEALPVPVANDELRRLAVTLNAMLDRLRRALEIERRFSADASHELRTPIGVMEAELDVALRSRSTPPEAREVLTSVKEEAAALGRIVANLVLLARADSAGAVALDRRDGDLLEIAGTIAGRFRSIAADKGIALSVQGDCAQVRVDVDMLKQAVSNLVENALRYTDRGGSVDLTVTDGSAPSLAVTDTGTGIPAEELPHIFDRFYRVDGARRRERGGAGLGLEISRRIVEAHGGRIDVTSESGKGSTFTIVLSAQSAPERAQNALVPFGVPRPVGPS